MVAPKILLIDHNGESAGLLRQSLTRKFPHALVRICDTSGIAIETAALEKLDVIVVHRTQEQEAAALVRILRKMDPQVVLIGMAETDRSVPFLVAGGGQVSAV
jgi:response regulator RpfG family c-di-GMP phosphodiesterase